MDTSRMSAIGRPIDLRYASNRFAAGASVLAGIAWGVWKYLRYDDLGDAVVRGLVALGATFVAWALGRELDPDRPWTAGVGALAAAALVGAGRPSLLLGAAVLLAARVTARTTGAAPRIGDLAALAGLAAWSASGDAGPGAGIVIGVVLVVDRWLPGGADRRTAAAGLVAIAGSVAAAAIWGAAPDPGFPEGAQWWVAGAGFAAVAGLGRPRVTSSTGDLTGEPLSPARVRLGRIAAVLGAATAFVWAGGPGLAAGSVVWAPAAAAALPSVAGRE